MTKLYVARGEGYMYTNGGAAISSGDVVIVDGLIGVASVDIAATTGTGWVHTQGVFTLPKVSAAVIAAGEEVRWDNSNSAFDDKNLSLASNDISGAAAWAVEAAGNGATTVKVNLTGVRGTVT